MAAGKNASWTEQQSSTNLRQALQKTWVVPRQKFPRSQLWPESDRTYKVRACRQNVEGRDGVDGWEGDWRASEGPVLSRRRFCLAVAHPVWNFGGWGPVTSAGGFNVPLWSLSSEEDSEQGHETTI
jgi:hypothetical protein